MVLDFSYGDDVAFSVVMLSPSTSALRTCNRSSFVAPSRLRIFSSGKYRTHFPTRRQQQQHVMPKAMSWKPAGLLQEIVDMKKLEVELMEETLMDRPDHPINMRRAFFAQHPTHYLSKSLRRRDGSMAIMASVKRLQPPTAGQSNEVIAPLQDVASDMRSLHVNGLDAALFSTDTFRHGIDMQDLRTGIRGLADPTTGRTRMPIVRHDFIIDAVQIAEASEAGACAVNVVAAAALPELMELLNAATMMGMEAIVECHSPIEVDFAMECGATILFLNNWDRSRNVLVPGTAEKLIETVPPFVLTIGGGGLLTSTDCWSLFDAGFNGVVLGKTILQSKRVAGFVKEIRSQKRYDMGMYADDAPFSEP